MESSLAGFRAIDQRWRWKHPLKEKRKERWKHPLKGKEEREMEAFIISIFK
jgi:hypothetical protein